MYNLTLVKRLHGHFSETGYEAFFYEKEAEKDVPLAKKKYTFRLTCVCGSTSRQSEIDVDVQGCSNGDDGKFVCKLYLK